MTIVTRGQGLSGEPPDSASSPQSTSGSVTSVPVCSAPETAAVEEWTEPEFPVAKLLSLDEKISNLRWVVPVLPDQELECLLQASIDLAKKGVDVNSEACQRFFREGLTLSFTKILTDDAVSSWKYNIHLCIYQNCIRLVELCVIKLAHDWFPLLDLLAMLFNPNNKFHTFNASRPCETVPVTVPLSEEEVYARPASDSRATRGWLVDLINRFGALGGFQALLERFQTGKNLSLSVVYALIRPFGLCHEYLTVHTITKYLMPVLETVPEILDKLTDDELKREAKNESKSDIVSAIIKSAKWLAVRVPQQEDMIRTLEEFRLEMILRQLQISSFNGKMNALNEVNKVIAAVTYYPNRHHGLEEEDYLTSERLAKWINENRVLEIVLRDSLHQPQYVEKLEKIVRFMIKERALSASDLDAVWSAQAGKHEAIVKNVHDLLAKLAWDFSPEQLDHLFECFQSSWTSANKKQREKLLELIRRLAEDDKDGVMAHKVLTLFWNLAHSEEAPTDIMDQALSAHIKILDYSCSQERDAQKTIWLDKCVEELKAGDQWALPALKQIRDICCLYEPSANSAHGQRTHHMYYRQEVIERLQNQHSLVILVTNSLTGYMERVRCLAREDPSLSSLNAETYTPDNRYNHGVQVQERLNFLRFLLRDGQLWLCAEQAKQIWRCLAEHAVFPSDREACFRWFSKLMGEEPDLDPGINRDFFQNNILQLDPALLTESGIKCFERFFKAVNTKEGKLKVKRRTLLTDDADLIGADYLWRVVSGSGEDMANRAIELLREVSTNLGPRLQASLVEYHETFVSECCDRLRAHYDTVSVLRRNDGFPAVAADNQMMVQRLRTEATKMCRVMKVLHEYMSECDSRFGGERKLLPLHRACRGKHLSLMVRFSCPGRQVDDMEVFTHSNDTLASLRRSVLRRIKASGANVKLELFVNGEQLDMADDRKLLSQIPLRDKMLLSAKLSQAGSNMTSSPDSSSDSSTSSPQHPYDGPDVEQEGALPGVLMSQQTHYAQFFCQLSSLGSALGHGPLRDSARALLLLMPADRLVVERLHNVFRGVGLDTLDSMFFSASPAQVLYHLEVMYAQLMPALDPMSERAFDFQLHFLTSGHVHVFMEMLTKNNFMPSADIATRRSAYLTVLKVCKMVMTVVGNVLVRLNEDVVPPEVGLVDSSTSTMTSNETPAATHVMFLRQALRSVPSHTAEHALRQVCLKLSSGSSDRLQALFSHALTWELPDINAVLALIRIAWAASSSSLGSSNASTDTLHQLCEPSVRVEPLLLHPDDVLLAKEALECLCLALILNPGALERLSLDKLWHTFLIDLVLLCPSRAVRLAAAEQFLVMCTCGAASRQALQVVAPLLFSVLDAAVLDNAHTSHEYFQLLCRLVNCAYVTGCPLVAAESLLASEIVWLRRASDLMRRSRENHVDEALLEGHLGLARELLCFVNPDKKHELGADDTKAGLIRELLEDFVFPASKLLVQLHRTGQMSATEAASMPVCVSPQSQAAAFDLLVALCMNCVPNCRQLVDMLTEMFYSEQNPPLQEWDYLPPVGPRPSKGFVGLKNAGATCYMNSVLQQLYMVESIREGLLASDGAATDPSEDFSGEDGPADHLDAAGSGQDGCVLPDGIDDGNGLGVGMHESSRRDYNIGILKQVQAIFGHLACSKLQYYVPRGLWRHFKLQGEPVNLREQQDAVEFFMSLIESIDEALKALGQDQIMGKVLGGSYSDQKICKGCPHRYSKEEPFSVISVDIRNHSTLQDSMEQYVKGELLEGADAYHCEKCARKVVTVKRLCVKKLPPVLAIQLKRFEYDFERVCPIKFNDYFEFPRDLDMEPYTVSGLARLEGEVIDCDVTEGENGNRLPVCTRYRLSGIVVHSGQASGGHYYSYILNREPDGERRWYKFDDGEVTECRMSDDEEMKVQCFGGDYMGEVFDPMLKRTSYRKQKRWWNAYMLFYTRVDVDDTVAISQAMRETLSLEEGGGRATSAVIERQLKMPGPIESSIRRQNVRFMHHRSQFSMEYMSFMRKLLTCNAPGVARTTPPLEEQEQLSMLCVQLASRFLFHTGFRTKKSLRGPALDWFELVMVHLRAAPSVRAWFAENALFQQPHRFSEYILECPTGEVRTAFTKLVACLCHLTLTDGPVSTLPTGCAPLEPGATLSDHLITAVLHLLRKEVSEHGRYLPNYCALFYLYAGMGAAERAQMLRLGIPTTFMLVALDEGPGPAIKYQYAELTKLHQLVTLLVRCCDVTAAGRCQSSQLNAPVLPNPYTEYVGGTGGTISAPPPLPASTADVLYGRTSYVKKLIEDSSSTEEAVRLLQFCSWENPQFSRVVLSELLWQIAFAYCQELRHHTELLLSVLVLEDSWQTHRIHNALKGVPEEREGLFDTVQRSKNHYQKRAYQCIKCMVALFGRCRPAHVMLHTSPDLKRRWAASVQWLHDELERRYPGNAQYAYSTWSPPAHSNDATNGYFLERSSSARKTLERAYELCPEDDTEEDEAAAAATVVETEDDQAPVGGEEAPGGTEGLGEGGMQPPPPPGRVSQQHLLQQQVVQGCDVEVTQEEIEDPADESSDQHSEHEQQVHLPTPAPPSPSLSSASLSHLPDVAQRGPMPAVPVTEEIPEELVRRRDGAAT